MISKKREWNKNKELGIPYPVIDNFIDEEGFWDLFNDLKTHNKWETAEILAFLDLCNFAEIG